ncbi:MAG: rhomboid family intramembrane serine protease [Bacteroidetes bacterium]|nr:rhomboid family intramembrane serine protease [Bacteroidota bacterium]
MELSFAETPVTLALIIINIAISVYAFFNRRVLSQLALTPYRMRAQREYHQLITSAFVHADPYHLFFNMMTLYFMGGVLEQVIYMTTGGRVAYMVIYLVSMLAGSLYPYFKYRNTPGYGAVGASGAISGVVFSFCLFAPLETLQVFFIPMPAVLFAVLYVGYSIYAMRRLNDNIGHEAHLAGAVAGLVATFAVAPGIVFFLR